ncbi:hypothetical protein [Accumulibacter sp.]|uniref:hypothetical protein n=1 Tax=Accumulibacter sp. TaxID=2053492 RepID=UPI00260AF265|nr:hypothetical protein [Accumulibacter sp.]
MRDSDASVIRFLVRLAAFLLLLLFGMAMLLLAALEPTPRVSRGETISPSSIAQARRLLASNDPRRLQRGDERTADLPAALIDDGINHLASRRLHGRGAFVLAEESAEIRLSLRVPGIPGPHYLNLSAVFRESSGEPRVASASLGSLPVPVALAELLMASAVSLAGFGQEWELARQSIRGLVFDAARGMVGVSYVWAPEILDRARSLAFTADDLSHVEAAQRAFAGLVDHYAPRARVPLPEILGPLLARSGETSPQARRSALLVLAIYLSGQDLATVLPESRQWPRPRSVKLMLSGRGDSAQHFAISAALAAWAGEPAANAIGVYKEIEDSRHGSGFSFADLAADRAGTRFGKLVADGSPRLEDLLRRTPTDADLVPPLGGLPEYLSQAEFTRRYGGRGNPAYRQLMADIESRLAALPLYR